MLCFTVALVQQLVVQSSAHQLQGQQQQQQQVLKDIILSIIQSFVLPLQVKMEEKSLMERYGQAYTDYKSRVKSLIPYVY